MGAHGRFHTSVYGNRTCAKVSKSWRTFKYPPNVWKRAKLSEPKLSTVHPNTNFHVGCLFTCWPVCKHVAECKEKFWIVLKMRFFTVSVMPDCRKVPFVSIMHIKSDPQLSSCTHTIILREKSVQSCILLFCQNYIGLCGWSDDFFKLLRAFHAIFLYWSAWDCNFVFWNFWWCILYKI